MMGQHWLVPFDFNNKFGECFNRPLDDTVQYLAVLTVRDGVQIIFQRFHGFTVVLQRTLGNPWNHTIVPK